MPAARLEIAQLEKNVPRRLTGEDWVLRIGGIAVRAVARGARLRLVLDGSIRLGPGIG